MKFRAGDVLIPKEQFKNSWITSKFKVIEAIVSDSKCGHDRYELLRTDIRPESTMQERDGLLNEIIGFTYDYIEEQFELDKDYVLDRKLELLDMN